ncbi:MAG TPA: hypothetical protein DDW90_02385 [Cyanobacteria bacterium UBA9971]|nr:hypothetical protein [Cyanobacteria bacterium UBA9971]
MTTVSIESTARGKIMKKNKIIDKLDELTLEADMLVEILYNSLKQQEAEQKTTSACYLLEIIGRKFRKIRALF